MTTDLHRLGRGAQRTRLIGVVAAIVMASVFALGTASIVAFERAVEPELLNRSRLIGTIVRGEIQRALDAGIPFDAVGGLDRYMGHMLARFEEVDRIVVHSSAGEVFAIAERNGAPPPAVAGTPATFEARAERIAVGPGSFTLPVLAGNELVGEIVIDTNPRFVQTRLRDVFLDVLIVALVAVIFALELLVAIAITAVGKPLDRILRLLGEQRSGNFLHRVRTGGIGGLGRAVGRFNDHAADLAERLGALGPALRTQAGAATSALIARGRPELLRLSDLNDMRLALFLFSLATEVAAAFLPLYAQAARRPDWLPPEVAAAAPLLCYLAAIATVSPFGGMLARRFGARRLFLAAVPPTVVALLGMGVSDSVVGITAWRVLLAACYAVATIACQEYAMRAVPERDSARPMGAFIAVVFGGVFCGAALGGLIAERLGFTAAFVAGALIATTAGGLALFAMRGEAGDAEPPRIAASGPSAPARSRSMKPLRDGRLLALLVGVAVPMNATTAIFIWYLTPLMLAELGSGPAELARVVMLYYLAIVVLGPAAAAVSDARTGPVPPVIAGALLCAAALLALSTWSGFWPLVAAVVAVGIGHALLRAPLYSLVLRLSDGATRVLAALRLIERIGALLGLAAGTVLLQSIGADGGIRILGLIVLAGGMLSAIVELSRRGEQRGG